MTLVDSPRFLLILFIMSTQLMLFGTESLGGVSGQDSIIRSSIASLDLSGGLLFLNAAYEYVFNPGRHSYMHIPRWRLLHSRGEDLTDVIRITTRTRWLPVFAPSKRRAAVNSRRVWTINQEGSTVIDRAPEQST